MKIAKRTSAGLRELLFEMIDGVRNGTVDDKTARTVATLASSVLKSVEVELLFRAQVMRGGVVASDMGELPLCDLPAPKAEPKPDERPRITNPIVPQGPRFVPGRNQSASQ